MIFCAVERKDWRIFRLILLIFDNSDVEQSYIAMYLRAQPPIQSIEIAVATIQTIHSGELLQRVDTAIKANPHLSGHQVFCQEESGVVVLHGQVKTFFEKQMAQESLKHIDGVEKVINELEVDWMPSMAD